MLFIDVYINILAKVHGTMQFIDFTHQAGIRTPAAGKAVDSVDGMAG
jgi:hypothetical protein